MTLQMILPPPFPVQQTQVSIVQQVEAPVDIPTSGPIEIPAVIEAPPEPPPHPPPIEYIVVEGDYLVKIASEQHTTVQRLFSKNTNISDPNVIDVGQKLVVPAEDEVLEERPTSDIVESAAPSSGDVPAGFSNSGNSYEPGQCVWALKEWRPELPNSWGNASDWLANAQRDGWSTGTEPRVGAVGWTSGHVVLITAVNGDGTVSYKDMNGRWIPFEIGYGSAPASKYLYIY